MVRLLRLTSCPEAVLSSMPATRKQSILLRQAVSDGRLVLTPKTQVWEFNSGHEGSRVPSLEVSGHATEDAESLPEEALAAVIA